MDLDVLVSSDGTWHEQINYAASKANRVFGLMKTHSAHGPTRSLESSIQRLSGLIWSSHYQFGTPT